MEYLITLELRDGYKIMLLTESEEVKARVESSKSQKTWTGILKDFPISQFLWMKFFPSLLKTRLFVNKETLEIGLSKGLLGSGTGAMQRQRKVDEEEAEIKFNDLDLDLVQENQLKSVNLAIKISKALANGSFDSESIDMLYDIKPYECGAPIGAAHILFEKIKNPQIWANPFDTLYREKTIKIVRKFLYAHIVKEGKGPLFVKKTQDKMIQDLNNVIELAERNEGVYPEISAIFELKVIKKLIAESKNSESLFDKFIHGLFAILKLWKMFVDRELGSVVNEFSKYFRMIRSRFTRNYSEYMLKFELFEMIQDGSPDIKEKRKKLLQEHLGKLSKLKWKEIYILISYIQDCVFESKLTTDYILNITEVIGALSGFKNWQVREKCIQLLRVLKKHSDKRVVLRAKEILKDRRQTETDERVKIVTETKVNQLNPPKNSSRSLKRFERISEPVISKKINCGKIHERLKMKNLLVICGFAGMGKTHLARQYCSEYEEEYDIIASISSESFIKDLSVLADTLGITRSNDVEESIKRWLKSGKIKENILLVFDNIEGLDEIREYYTRSNKVKFLITSRNKDWPDTIEVSLIDTPEIEHFLANEIPDASREKIAELSIKLNGWGTLIGLCLSYIQKGLKIEELLKKNFSDEEDVKSTIDQILGKMSKELRFVVRVLGKCGAKNIPEEMIKRIFQNNYVTGNWISIKEKLLGSFFISIEPARSMINIQEAIHKALSLHAESQEIALEYLKFFDDYFNICDETLSSKENIEKAQNLTVHVEAVLKNVEISDFSLKTYLNLAASYLRITHELEKLGKLTEKIEKFLRNSSENSRVFWFLKVGILYHLQGNLSRAEECYFKELENGKEFRKENKGVSESSFYMLGCLFKEKGEYAKAEKYLMDDIEMLEKSSQSNCKYLSKSFGCLGDVCKLKGEYDRAEGFYMKELEIKQKLLPGNHPDLALTFHRLGSLCQAQGDYSKAETYFMKISDLGIGVLF